MRKPGKIHEISGARGSINNNDSHNCEPGLYDFGSLTAATGLYVYKYYIRARVYWAPILFDYYFYSLSPHTNGRLDANADVLAAQKEEGCMCACAHGEKYTKRVKRDGT